MKSRALLKIELRDKGIEILSSRFHPNGTVTLSFSLPKPVMKKFKKLKNTYKFRKTYFEEKLKEYDITIPSKETWYSPEFEQYIIDNKIQLSKPFKDKDYVFSSINLSLLNYNKVIEICKHYKISKSSFIRILVEQANV